MRKKAKELKADKDREVVKKELNKKFQDSERKMNIIVDTMIREKKNIKMFAKIGTKCFAYGIRLIVFLPFVVTIFMKYFPKLYEFVVGSSVNGLWV